MVQRVLVAGAIGGERSVEAAVEDVSARVAEHQADRAGGGVRAPTPGSATGRCNAPAPAGSITNGSAEAAPQTGQAFLAGNVASAEASRADSGFSR